LLENTMKTIRYAPLLLAFAISQAFAGTPINLSKNANPDVHLSIENVKGVVTVSAWDRNQVEVSGTLGDGARPLQIEGSPGALSIKVEAEGASVKSSWFNWGNDKSMEGTTLNVRVPKGAHLDIDVVSAPVSIDGIDGGKIDINTVSGRVRANARTPSLSVDSVSGSIDMAGLAQKADLQTVSGDIVAPSVGGELDAQTVSGRITIGGGPFQKASLSTVSGDVQLTGDLANNGSIDVDSMSGDVQLQVPSTLSAKITATSFSGDLRSDYGNASKVEDGPGKELKTVAGSGHGKINVETFSGDVRIRQQAR
jgi:DUF4097 and DUF4098 domain-containing protein YvlB